MGKPLTTVHAFELGYERAVQDIVEWLKRDDVNAQCWGDPDGPWTAREYAKVIETKPWEEHGE